MRRASRDDVAQALGDVDEVVMAEVLATGATVDELAEARAWLANDEAMMNDGRPLAAGRIGRLVEIIAAAEEERVDAADGREP